MGLLDLFSLDPEDSITYKVGPDDPVIVYKNGGFGLNFHNPKLMLKLYEKTKAMAELDDREKKKKRK